MILKALSIRAKLIALGLALTLVGALYLGWKHKIIDQALTAWNAAQVQQAYEENLAQLAHERARNAQLLHDLLARERAYSRITTELAEERRTLQDLGEQDDSPYADCRAVAVPEPIRQRLQQLEADLDADRGAP